jgi:hypothetical protein
MNPVKFLFESLRFLGYETQILEACDWDEDRAKIVISELQRILSDSPEAYMPGKDLLSNISEKLSENLSVKEVDSCLCIIDECLSSFSQLGDQEYEN